MVNDQRPFPPRTRAVEVPVGEAAAPVHGTIYWVPVLGGAAQCVWAGGSFDRRMLAAGMIYLTREEAEAASRAIYGEAE